MSHYHPDHSSRHSLFPLGDAPPPAIDPVCGMSVDPVSARASTVHQGKHYYFCCPHCLERFQSNPDRYLQGKPSPAEQAPAPPGSKYSCPMHPEVVQDHPGSCPVCGMALEPLVPTAEEGPNPEVVDMTRRFWVSLVFAL